MIKARAHFRKKDKKMYKLCLRYKGVAAFKRRSNESYFADLCETIINQQLSAKAAKTIWNRFVELFLDKIPTPEKLIKLRDEKIRMAGISWQKIKYLKDLSRKINNHELELNSIVKKSDEEVIQDLTKVNGIGKWSAEMFLIFTLARQDIFSSGDLGLKRAVEKLYDIKDPSKDELEKIALKWSPFRSFASRLLWQSLNNK